jgi:NADH-quinone oxidoreductase subunit J
MLYNFFILLLTLSIIVACILLLLSSNKIYSVLYLIFIYMCVSLLMMYLGVLILGLFYFLVYIGAIAVLFLFSIMILDLKESIFERDYSFFMSIFILLVFFIVHFYFFFIKLDMNIYNFSFEYFVPTNEILKILGLLIFQKYSFLLLLAGLVLLIAMLGAIYLTNNKKGFFIKKQLFPLSRNYNLYHCLVY